MHRLVLAVILAASPVMAEEVYFATTLGDGSSGNPYKSGCAPGASAIDLRSTTGKDLWVCRSTDMVGATGAVSLGKTIHGAMSGKARSDIAVSLGRGMKAQTSSVQDLLKELLIDSGKIQPDKDGKLKIYLGDPAPVYEQTSWVPFNDHGLVADVTNWAVKLIEPAIAWAAILASETFTGTDGDLDARTFAHTWTEFGITGWTVASNQATTTTTTTGANNARLETALSTANHQVEADLVTVSHSGGGFTRCGVLARKDNSSTQTYYAFFADSTVTGFESSKRVANVTTSLATNTQDPVNGADRMKLIVDGSTVTGQVNGVTVVGPTTDVDITSNTYVGIYGHASTATFTCTLDNVLGQDYPPPGAAGSIRRRHS